MSKYSNILFDLDGTLLATKSGVLSSVKKAFAKLGFNVPPDEKMDSFMGPPLEQCFTDVCGLTREQAREAITVFRGFYGTDGLFDAHVFEGVPELLKELKKGGLALGVATSKNEAFAVKVLEHFGLSRFFGVVSGARPEIKGYSKADSVRAAIAALPGANSENTVLIGDRRFDAEGATDAGIDSIGVLYGYGTLEELESSDFVMLAETAKDIKMLLL